MRRTLEGPEGRLLAYIRRQRIDTVVAALEAGAFPPGQVARAELVRSPAAKMSAREAERFVPELARSEDVFEVWSAAVTECLRKLERSVIGLPRDQVGKLVLHLAANLCDEELKITPSLDALGIKDNRPCEQRLHQTPSRALSSPWGNGKRRYVKIRAETDVFDPDHADHLVKDDGDGAWLGEMMIVEENGWEQEVPEHNELFIDGRGRIRAMVLS